MASLATAAPPVGARSQLGKRAQRPLLLAGVGGGAPAEALGFCRRFPDKLFGFFFFKDFVLFKDQHLCVVTENLN